MVSVTVVSTTPVERMSSRAFSWPGVGCWPMRAARSAAMMERARSNSEVRKDAEKPRTPVRAATPIATERSTNRNLPRDACISREAILPADLQVSALAMVYPPTGTAAEADRAGSGRAALRSSETMSPSRRTMRRVA